MATVKGTVGKDYIHVHGDGKHAPDGYANNNTATGLADTINIAQGGADIVLAGAGDDTIKAGAALTAADQINGQAGNDTLILDGNYSTGLTFGAKTLTSVETIQLVNGNSYNLTLNDASTATRGMTFTIDGRTLDAHSGMIIDGSAETDAILAFYAGAGDDVLRGGGVFGNGYELSTGGNDTAIGTATVDYFYLGGALNAKDKLSGGGGFGDRLYLDGDYHKGVTFNATTVVDISTMYLAAGHDYKFTLNDATISAGRTMTIDGTLLGAGNMLTLNAAAETNGSITLNAGAGDDVITGGKGSLVLGLGTGGNDTVNGGAGHEQIYFGTTFDANDHVNGGSGGDDLVIIGGLSPQSLTLGGATMKNVGTLQINGGAYDITTLDNLVAAGNTMTIKQLFPAGTDVFTFDGSAESNGAFVIYGAGGGDTITTGAGNDILKGFGGQDTLRGGAGADVYLYTAVTESSSTSYDKIIGFNFKGADRFDLPSTVTVSGIDAKLNAGKLSTASFDTDLGAKITAAKLAAGHAVLFTPDHGTLAGHTFMVVDANGTAGYQANGDFVFDLVSAANLTKLDIADFF